jgi:hypothetical protein
MKRNRWIDQQKGYDKLDQLTFEQPDISSGATKLVGRFTFLI